MDPATLFAFESRRPEIRFRWEALLRVERVHTPLANPSTLVFMFDHTLDEVLRTLAAKPARQIGSRPTSAFAHNPLREYYAALEQALLEALVYIQAGRLATSPAAVPFTSGERAEALDEVRGTLREIARRELAVFDDLCRSVSQKAEAAVEPTDGATGRPEECPAPSRRIRRKPGRGAGLARHFFSGPTESLTGINARAEFLR